MKCSIILIDRFHFTKLLPIDEFPFSKDYLKTYSLRVSIKMIEQLPSVYKLNNEPVYPPITGIRQLCILFDKAQKH